MLSPRASIDSPSKMERKGTSEGCGDFFADDVVEELHTEQKMMPQCHCVQAEATSVVFSD